MLELWIAAVAAAPPGDGYVGLKLREIPGEHAVVSWMLPGPMKGEGLTCAEFDIARPDLIVSVDGLPIGESDVFDDHVRGVPPGSWIDVAYRKSRSRDWRIPDTLDHEDEVLSIRIPVVSRDRWTGTIERGRGHATELRFAGAPMLDHRESANVLGAAIASEGMLAPLETLLPVYTEWLDDAPDFHGLSRIRAPFVAPLRLPELADAITAETAGAVEQPFATALALAAANLDLSPVVPDAADPELTAIETTRLAYINAIAAAGAGLGDRWNNRAFARQCLDLLRVPRRSFYLQGDDAFTHIGVIRASMNVDFDLLLQALGHLGPLADLSAARILQTEPGDIGAVREAVQGEIVQAIDLGAALGWIVVGGDGDNTYDMNVVAIALDTGGNDTYVLTNLQPGVRGIVDLDGDDTYIGSDDQGPAAAVLGASLIDDRAGNDRYSGGLLSAGAACFGASLLLDRGGADVYSGTEWSQGAACYGAGMIIDLGRESDVYLGEFLCQGVGGPRGFGCIIDAGGRELYRANGPEPSIYGTAAVFQSFSQGMGFGFRYHAAGGVGMISDLRGSDRYEAGEFAQGGGYYFGLGVLHDASGDDLYYGNRYGQGFGVHQALGMLVDDGGNDTYWSMTAASQGAAWDVGAGLLLDRAGDDSYQCDNLGQGAASQQAIGMLIDLGGADRYSAGPSATQGQSGANTYHYARTGAHSFSLLLDLGGADDYYSSGRPNDAVTSTGEVRSDAPAESRAFGVAIDR